MSDDVVLKLGVKVESDQAGAILTREERWAINVVWSNFNFDARVLYYLKLCSNRLFFSIH